MNTFSQKCSASSASLECRRLVTNEPPRVTTKAPFAKIDRLGNNKYSIIEFTLKRDTRVDIYAVGEYFVGKMVDYGGIEDLSSGKLIWSMTRERTQPAGGGALNRQATDAKASLSRGVLAAAGKECRRFVHTFSGEKTHV